MAEDFNKKVSLIEIEVDNSAAKARVEELTSAILMQKKEVKKNADEIKDLNKENKSLADQVKKGEISQKDATKAIEENNKKITQNEKANFSLRDELKDTNKERLSAVKASNLQSNSLDALRKRTADQKKELNGLNTSTVEGRKKFEKLTKSLESNNAKIRELDKSAGDFKTSVGNYSGAITDAAQKSGIFGGVIGKLSQAKQAATAFTTGFATATRASTAATTGASKALKILKIALISTGIGAIVVVLGSLISAFLSTQEGIDKVTSVTRPFFAVLNKLKGLVQELASGAFAGLAQILNGDISEGLATIKGAFTEAIGGVGDAVKGGIEAGSQLDKLQKQIEKTENALIVNKEKLNNEFQNQKSIAEDITRTEKERITAAQAAQKALAELQSQQQSLIDLKIEQKKLENSLNDTSREAEGELQELIAERIRFEAEATKKTILVRNLENTITKGLANERKGIREKEFTERQKLTEQQAAAAEKQRSEELAAEKKLAEEKAANEMVLNQKLLALSEFRRSQSNESRLKEAEDAAEYFTLKQEIEAENFELERERLAEQLEVSIEDESLTAEEKAIRQAEYDLTLEQLKAEHADTMTDIANQQKDEELAIEEEKKNKRLGIINAAQQAGRQIIQGGLDITNNVIDNFYNKRFANIQSQLESGQITQEQYERKRQSLEKNKAKSVYKAQVAEFRIKKAINIASIIADTAKSVGAAIAASPLTGGLPFSAINAALGVVQLVKVATEKPPPPPTFASGGDVFGTIAGGNLHSAGGTKYKGEDGNAFEVERGEGIFVTKRSATNPALKLLDQANTMNGGNSMFGNSSRFLQDGGQVSQENSDMRTAQLINEAMANMPAPVVEVQSILGGINSEMKSKKTGVI